MARSNESGQLCRGKGDLDQPDNKYNQKAELKFI